MEKYESNIDKVLIEIQKEVINPLTPEKSTQLMTDITSGLLRTIRRRIHRDGMAVNNSPIGGGQYSTEPMYINPNKGAVKVGLANKGKHGQSKFKNGRDHKTRFYSEGYKEWRTVNKKIVNKVNLEFKGDLRRGFTFQKLTNRHFTLGFSNDREYKKHNGLESKYRTDIWGIGTREEKIIDDTLKIYLK